MRSNKSIDSENVTTKSRGFSRYSGKWMEKNQLELTTSFSLDRILCVSACAFLHEVHCLDVKIVLVLNIMNCALN